MSQQKRRTLVGGESSVTIFDAGYRNDWQKKTREVSGTIDLDSVCDSLESMKEFVETCEQSNASIWVDWRYPWRYPWPDADEKVIRITWVESIPEDDRKRYAKKAKRDRLAKRRAKLYAEIQDLDKTAKMLAKQELRDESVSVQVLADEKRKEYDSL